MKNLLTVITVLLVLPLGGCQRDQRVLQEAVRHYCLLLAESYQNHEVAKLGFVATEAETQRVYRHMAALAEGRTRMVARLISIQWLAVVEENSTSARVKTSEEWGYRHINMDSGKIMLENTVGYTLQYHLQRSNDMWLVAGVDILTSQEGKAYGTLPFLQRPPVPMDAVTRDQ